MAFAYILTSVQNTAHLFVSGSYCTVSSSSRQSGLEAAFSDNHSTCQSCSLLQYHFGTSARFNLASRTEPARPAETVPAFIRHKVTAEKHRSQATHVSVPTRQEHHGVVRGGSLNRDKQKQQAAERHQELHARQARSMQRDLEEACLDATGDLTDDGQLIGMCCLPCLRCVTVRNDKSGIVVSESPRCLVSELAKSWSQAGAGAGAC